MRVSQTLLAAAFAVASSGSLFVRADASAASSDVVTLTSDTFKDFLKKPLSLIEFYAPWCGHCKALAPEYEVAATELKDTVPIAKVDCTIASDLCQEQGIEGYPTLKVFRDGSSADYKGQSTSDNIISYMRKQALPAISKLTSDKVKDFSASDKVVIVGFFDDLESKEYKEFESVAEKLRNEYIFGVSSDAAALKENDVKSPSVVLFKKFDEGRNVLDKSFTGEELTEFVKTNSVPVMDDISGGNYAAYLKSGLPLAYLFVGDAADRKEAGSQVEPIAKEFKGKINFVYLEADKFSAHAKNLNLKQTWPAFVIEEMEKNKKFPFDQSKTITKESIKSFVEDYLNGKLEPSIKSEAIPEKNDGPVRVVVGKNYEAIVLDKSKDVLLEFYAPWCGHCKALAPVWEELGEKVKSTFGDNVVIAKMDATENDVPVESAFEITGFPTIKLFKADSNEIIDYSGDRTVDSFFDFLKKNVAAAVRKTLDYQSGKAGAAAQHPII
ncbi:thioredoxin-like domain-containing protein [Phlyctochytrium arcticum]|nr:thioredoxin-like domain-containing protein [Phlyctochytrium arcticum]